MRFANPPNQSKGILDDFSIRKTTALRQGTITHTPTNENDIVNKKYVDDNIFSGDYDDLTNKPDIPEDITDLESGDNKIFYGNHEGEIQELSLGDDGEFLMSNGDEEAPTWEEIEVPSSVQVLDKTIVDPYSMYEIDTQVFLMRTRTDIKILRVIVECDADPATEITGDLKSADSFIGLANPVLITDIDTTNGKRDEDEFDEDEIDLLKVIYLQFDTQPDENIKQLHIHIEYEED